MGEPEQLSCSDAEQQYGWYNSQNEDGKHTGCNVKHFILPKVKLIYDQLPDGKYCTLADKNEDIVTDDFNKILEFLHEFAIATGYLG